MLNEVASLALLAALLGIARYKLRPKVGAPLPPGRPGWPLLGNTLDLAAVLGREWEAYVQWGQELGSDIVYMNAMGQSIISLNNREDADALLDKRSATFSSRPKLNMVWHMGWDWVLPLLPYGEKWRTRRKLLHQHFHPNDNVLHKERATEFLHRTLYSFLQRPSDVQEINKDFISGLMFSLAYGIDLTKEPKYLSLCEDAIRPLVAASVPGRFLIDFVPWLKYVPEWMPGASFQRKAAIWREQQRVFKHAPFAEALRRMRDGESNAPPSFVSLAMGHRDLDPEELKSDSHALAVQETAAMFYAAGSETTIAVLDFLFLALVLHPDVQRRAQRELDDLLVERDGHIRLPDAGDIEQLPYIRAIVKEVLRWQPVAPIGVPHVSTEDDVYKGYFIPKGSIVIANSWAMLRNAATYSQESSFIPERFIKEDGSLNPDIPNPEEVAFGFGRRICPGMHIALSTVPIAAATVLLLFDICKSVDENGEEIVPRIETTCGLARGPMPFSCTLKPRSEAAKALIKSLALDDMDP